MGSSSPAATANTPDKRCRRKVRDESQAESVGAGGAHMPRGDPGPRGQRSRGSGRIHGRNSGTRRCGFPNSPLQRQVHDQKMVLCKAGTDLNPLLRRASKSSPSSRGPDAGSQALLTSCANISSAICAKSCTGSTRIWHQSDLTGSDGYGNDEYLCRLLFHVLGMKDPQTKVLQAIGLFACSSHRYCIRPLRRCQTQSAVKHGGRWP